MELEKEGKNAVVTVALHRYHTLINDPVVYVILK